MTTHIYTPELGNASFNVVGFDGYMSIGSDGYLIAASSSIPKGLTATHAGNQTGVYVLTSDVAFKHIFPTVTMAANAGVNLQAQLKSVTTTVVTINVVAGATPTNPSAVSGIFFHLSCRN